MKKSVDFVGAIKNIKKYEGEYNKATPFPHCVLDDFLDTELLDELLEGFPVKEKHTHARAQELYKTVYRPYEEGVSEYISTLFCYFNSKHFIEYLEGVTGINGIIPDPYFFGGGLHETKQGGKLGIHADFTFHEKLKLRRRINVIIYLNRDWDPSWGGALELWSKDMKEKVVEVVPAFNRCVIFNTDSTSYHGHPDELSCPEGVSRKSIALYYYTNDIEQGDYFEKSTKFKARRGSGDRVDVSTKLKVLVRNVIPPFLYHIFRKR